MKFVKSAMAIGYGTGENVEELRIRSKVFKG